MARDAKDFLDMRVIATDNGHNIGTVDELLFEPGKHALLGMIVKSDDGKPKLFLGREKVRSFGHDAITVPSSSATEVLDSNESARRLAVSGGHLLHMDVFTEDGNKVGSIDRVLLNDDGTINAYRASSGLLGLGSKQDIIPSDVVGASEDSIIVSGAETSQSTSRS